MLEIDTKPVAGSRILALGVVLAALVAMMLMAAAPAQAASQTYTVTNTNDSGTGSLRRAIEDANRTVAADTIAFNITGGGVATITPESELPAITTPTTIDGYSQPGASANTLASGNNAALRIELSGALLTAEQTDGLTIYTPSSTVKGLIINRWTGAGIGVYTPDATNARITGNYIGTDATGTRDLGNSYGVKINETSSNTVGGTTPAARNVISGNNEDASSESTEGYGVYISGDESTGNDVLGNYIGTDASGTRDLGNDSDGVHVSYGAGNRIGGSDDGARNVVSGNGGNGVVIENGLAVANSVRGNYIGVDASGTAALGNDLSGVVIDSSSESNIGGTGVGDRNVISANGSNGVVIQQANISDFGPGATSNRVLGNYIGTDATGTKDLGNSGSGVWIRQYAWGNFVGGTTGAARNVISGNEVNGVFITGSGCLDNEVKGNYIGTAADGTSLLGNSGVGVAMSYGFYNVVGGTEAGAGNRIVDNDGGGVLIFGTPGGHNRILSNSVYANGLLGIDLNGDGPTANDPGDTDTGPNDLQNYPVLSTARTVSGNTTVRGTLNSVPNEVYVIQIFSNPNGTRQGKTLLGQTTVTTDAAGNASFAFKSPKAVKVGRAITATATANPTGLRNTSEFSEPRRVTS